MILSLLATFVASASEHSIINGEVTDQLPQVVALYAANETTGSGYFFCSGTVIGPQTVVTAAHCIAAMDKAFAHGYSDLMVISGTNVFAGGDAEWFCADFWVAHPGYNDVTLANDIGIVGLPEGSIRFDVMPVNKDPLMDYQIGDDYRYVGWGNTADQGGYYGVKRYADIPLESYTSTLQIGNDQEDLQNVCYGDSGGAVLEFQPNGGFELSAVNSFVFDDDSTPCEGGYTGGVRVDAYLGWLEQYTELWSAEELAALPDPAADELHDKHGSDLPDELPAFQPEEQLPEDSAGCSTVPAPAGLGLGAGMLLFRRRRPSSNR